MATDLEHPIFARANGQTPPTCGAALSLLLGTLVQLRFGRPSVAVDDVAKRAQGLPHVRRCNAGGSSADLLLDPATGGGVRVGFDLPARFEVPTLQRFGGSRLGAGVS
jgi:hypothetical protein